METVWQNFCRGKQTRPTQKPALPGFQLPQIIQGAQDLTAKCLRLAEDFA
jgi:hypothetical protein